MGNSPNQPWNDFSPNTAMTSLTLWYLTITLLGLLTFPLAHRLFPALADRGYTLARTLGLLLWGFFFWLLASLGVVQNDTGGILLALVIVMGLVIWALRIGEGKFKANFQVLVDWLKSNWKLVFATEVLFLVAFSFMAVVRAANPESLGTEKPMELAFINAILRSPTFPPHDPWLSGYAISYYYFGYVMAAMLAKFTATSGGMAFNLMLALLFSLNAAGVFGVGYNLLTAYTRRRSPDSSRSNILPSFLFPLFLLIVSNFEGFLEVLHRRGILWSSPPNFWTWLGILNLQEPPLQPLGWIPDQWYWWWRASRVVTDYTLSGIHDEVIDEFPAFSYVLGDLHPHVLAMPFVLLVIAMALNLFLGGWEGETNFFGLIRPRIRPAGFIFAGIVLGGMAFLNTWDFPILLALLCSAYVLTLVLRDGWAWARALDFLELAIPLGILSIVLYLPFFVGFQSQAGGILPNIVNPSRGAHLWVMFGPFFILLFAYLLYHWRIEKSPSNWKTGWILAIAGVLALYLFSLLLATLMMLVRPEVADAFLNRQGVVNTGALFASATARRLLYFGGLMTLLMLMASSLAFLSALKPGTKESQTDISLNCSMRSISPFIFLLILFGTLLVLAPEFMYLKDGFGDRMNTVFKFYYQAWLMWSLAAAFSAIILLRELRGVWRGVFAIVFALVLVPALVYAPLGFLTKTNQFNPPIGFTLDASAHLQSGSPDDAAAIDWLKTAPLGIVVEAVGGQYSEYARAATYSGQPDVLGWPGHEGQWRGSDTLFKPRESDIPRLYETRNWDEAKSILDQYEIKYVYFGNLERNTYDVVEEKFMQHLPVAFSQGSVTIYVVP
jgi:YYY domain-containing protein